MAGTKATQGIRRRVVVACCVVIALVMRGSDLVSDPPADLEDSGGYFADEGFWTHNARNKVLFGEWVLDEWNNMYASPLTHWPQYLSFRLLGPGLAQARVIPAVLSSAGCALLAALPGPAGILAALLYLVDALFLHFGRIALLETPVIFMLLASWALLSGAPGRGRVVLAGLAGGFAVATKLTVLYFVPAALLALLLKPPQSGRTRSVAAFATGITVACVVWVLMVGSGMPLFFQYARFYASQQSPWAQNLVSNLREPVMFLRFHYSLPLAVAGFVLAAGLATPALRGLLPREVTLACLWAILGALYLHTLTYDPLRYYMPLLPAFLIMVAWASVEAWHGRLRLAPGALGIAVCLVFLWPLAFRAIAEARPSAVYWAQWRVVAAFVATVGGVAGGWWIALCLLRSRLAGRAVALVVIGVCAATGVRAYSTWLAHRERVVFSVSRDLGHRFRDAVFTGQWAPELCLENTHRAVPVWPGFVNGQDDPFGDHGITHGVIWGRHWDKFGRWFPSDFARATILDTLWIKGTPVILCEFVPQPRPAPPDTAAEVVMPSLTTLDPDEPLQ